MFFFNPVKYHKGNFRDYLTVTYFPYTFIVHWVPELIWIFNKAIVVTVEDTSLVHDDPVELVDVIWLIHLELFYLQTLGMNILLIRYVVLSNVKNQNVGRFVNKTLFFNLDQIITFFTLKISYFFVLKIVFHWFLQIVTAVKLKLNLFTKFMLKNFYF